MAAARLLCRGVPLLRPAQLLRSRAQSAAARPPVPGAASRAAASISRLKAAASSGAEAAPTALRQMRCSINGRDADAFMEGLMGFGASSASVEDAHRDTPAEQRIYREDWGSAGAAKHWDACTVTALFPAAASDADIAATVDAAADSVGLSLEGGFTLEEVPECDWIQQVGWKERGGGPCIRTGHWPICTVHAASVSLRAGCPPLLPPHGWTPETPPLPLSSSCR